MLVIPSQHEGTSTTPPETAAAVGRAICGALTMLARPPRRRRLQPRLPHCAHQHGNAFHWHAHLWPKLVTVAGFERGTGVMINIAPPEEAAQELRSVARIATS